MNYSFKSTFLKAFDKLPCDRQILVTKAVEALDSYFGTGKAAHGLQVKKLHEGRTAKTFEARVSLDLRIVWVQSQDRIVFSLVGNHNEVRKFLKNVD